jgi:hypothetical protein
MTPTQINEFFLLMGKTSSLKRDNIRSIFLDRIGEDIIGYCEKYYRSSSKADFRNDLLRFVIRYARKNRKSTNLAIAGLEDKSKKVRGSAIAILAYSLDKCFIEILKDKKYTFKGNEESIKNAIHAIENKNHNLFYPAYTKWEVTEDDLEGYLNKEKHQEDIELYINRYAPELSKPIQEILNVR